MSIAQPHSPPLPTGGPADLGNLDRFQLLKVLGEGAQGIVYLAFDPHLERQVAIKSMGSANHRPSSGDTTTNGMQMLLREARMVSKFQHRNIVSIYEIGFVGDAPYLVLEYVSGPLLSAIIKTHPTGLPVDQAIAQTMQILDGLSFAHNRGIIHGDLKPANILVTPSNIAKITDFGIARGIGEKSEEGLAGSPRYMAPEYVTRRIMTPAADQFAAGLIMYQLLTGKHPVTGSTMEQIFDLIAAANFAPPSSLNAEVPAEIDLILGRALAAEPQARFEQVSDFRQSLEEYQAEIITNITLSKIQPKEDSLRTLRQRIRDQKDFPALSGSISNMSSLFAGNQKNAPAIAAVIAKDLALTTKVMRIANSAYVSSAGGEITSLSHAVMMLGFNTVREIASSLIMIDMTGGKEKSLPVKEQLVRSLFSATLARKIAIRRGEQNVDDCYLIGMFYRFGKLLVCFHMPELQARITEAVNAGASEADASLDILGYSYLEIGYEIAADWSLPEFLVNSLQPLELENDATLRGNGGLVYAAISNDITDLLASADGENSLRPALSRLRDRYESVLDMSGDEIEEILDGSRADFSKYCTILKIDTQDIALIDGINNWSTHFPETTPDAENPGENSRDITAVDLAEQNNKTTATLTRGVAEISQLLASDGYDFDDLIRKILASIYYGTGCHRVLLCRCLDARQQVKARYAVGKKVQSLLKQFQFPLDGNSQMFSRAALNGTDIIVSDLEVHSIQEPVPDWYRRLGPAGSFALLPFQLAGRVGGLLYLDHPKPHYLDHLPVKNMALIGQLRELAAQAYDQRGATELPPT